MKFKQIRLDLFQIGSNDFAMWKEYDRSWLACVVDGDKLFVYRNLRFYSRKLCAEWVMKSPAKRREVIRQGHLYSLEREFEAPKLRPPPVVPFSRLLSRL